MARCHVRCRACRTRRVLPKKPADYRNLSACPKCEKENTGDSYKCSGCGFSNLSTAPKCSNCRSTSYSVDKWMNERDTHATLCGCDGYHFQYHRVGSLQCKFNADRTYRGGDIVELPGIELPF